MTPTSVTDFIFKCYLIIFLIVYCCSIVLLCDSSQVSPEIKLATVCLERGDQQPFNYVCVDREYLPDIDSSLSFPFDEFDKNNAYIFPHEDNDNYNSKIIIKCTATYPVEWIHSQEEWLSTIFEDWVSKLKFQQVTFAREEVHSSAIHHGSSAKWQFSSTLTLHNSVRNLGEFVCSGVNKTCGQWISPKVKIFRELDTFDTAFPLAKKNVTIWVNEDESDTIVLPCYVYNPKFNVTLRKKVVLSSKNNLEVWRWEKVKLNKHLTFNPSQGFIFRKNPSNDNLQTFMGIYKCCVVFTDDDDKQVSNGGSNDDFVLVSLMPSDPPKTDPVDLPISPPAHFQSFVNLSTRTVEIICCANKGSPPDMYYIPCFNRRNCETQNRHLHSLNSHDLGQHFVIQDSCRKSVNITYGVGVAMNVRCAGEEINNISKTLIFPVDTNVNSQRNDDKLNPYTSWDEVNSSTMLAFVPTWKHPTYVNGSKLIVYDKQKITLKCLVDLSYFAEGSWFSINFKNGSNVNEKENLKSLWMYGLRITVIQMVVTKSLHSIACHAPEIYSQDWTTKNITFLVEDGQPTKLYGVHEQTVTWMDGDSELKLKCEFAGAPLPDVVAWSKDNKILSRYDEHTHQSLRMSRHTSSTLVINTTNYDAKGTYKCTAWNTYGNSSKLFRVVAKTRAAANWEGAILKIVIGLCCFLIMVGIVYVRSVKCKCWPSMSTHFR